MIGKKFGRLTVVEFSHKSEKRLLLWKCLCDCGNETIVAGSLLRRYLIKSCGCLNTDKTRIEKGKANFNALFLQYKHNSLRRKIEFKLTKEQFREITSKNCYYCGIEPNIIRYCSQSHGKYIHNGIDRVNSDLGYILDNSVPCCKFCNYSKHTLSQEEFKESIKRCYLYLFKNET